MSSFTCQDSVRQRAGVAVSCWGLRALGGGLESVVEAGWTSVLREHSQTRLWKFLSAIRPAPHYSRFTTSTARREHFGDVHVTAEANEVVAALQIVLPATEARIVAEVIVAGERLRKFAVGAG